ncbi:MAG TPA: carboxypeptidase [Pseudolabrys sp.]|jgi:carboxypeptidase C (cathepsin A)|nr:carboxypeptidase [Pseudolabrys sp.]
MTLSFIHRVALVTLLAAALGTASAEEAAKDRPQPSPAERHDQGKGVLRLLPADAVTEHSIDTPGGRISYTATAGTLPFYDQSGDQSASVFYTAYVAKDAPPNRPLTFVFNGGPGAASAFLHLGLVGPRVLDFGPDYDAARATLRDNPDTWLAFTDLVLIDPIGTGWSRPVKPDDGKHFWSVRSDADAMAKAVALYVAKNNRAGSPKYLFGESYGGFRAAKTARALQNDQGIVISGIVMLSPLLEGWLTFGDDQSALTAALQLPSLAAAELERKHAFTGDALAAAEKFAMSDYLTTLAATPPKGEAASAFYGRVAQLTGLPVDAVTQARGFAGNAYVKSLRASDRKIVSRYDAAFAVDDPYPERRSSRAPDPILDAVSRAYGGAMASYARNELGFKTEMTYALLAGDVTNHWDWQGGRVQASIEDDLRVLLAYGPSFRLLIAHGYSDMITPFAATRYVLDHMPAFDPPGRVQLKLYHGGHMLYLEPQSRKAFSADAAAFFRSGE